ncbi:glycosyltransferase family 9 protein [Silvibacterium dinghuense]|uniref:Glycosyltransferase family 9 protein n=1 Tax=Silvibacterium dinghuense TaxID=1560006 RepID=A0A4V1NUQ9_9BACT|nr:glycosyltransferase family 9 protein [Silvibacterium dinghuense]
MSGIATRSVKRVLIYRLGSLGDTVVALPALRLVARTFAHAQKMMLTNLPVHAKAPAASAILGSSGLVDGYFSYPVGTRSPIKLLRLWWSIRRFRPDILIYLAKPRGEQAVLRDERFFRSCGVKTIVGLPLGDRAINLQYSSGLWESEAGRLARSIKDLGEIDLDAPESWDLGLSEAEERKASNVLSETEGRPLIACGPGTKMQAKDWGTENWCALMTVLSGKLDRHVLVLVGAKEDRDVSAKLAVAWGGMAVNLCGDLSPRETAAVLRRTELFLGPDSGPMHFAAGAGVPCVIAFAARTRPGIWFPQGNGHRVLYRQMDCAGCNLETCTEHERKCLTAISVEDMFHAAMEVLERRRSESGAACE